MQPYSVLMSVYFREKPVYLKAAVDSMLSQTVRPDELVLVCDGPLTPELDAVIAEYPWLNVIRLEKNSGLGAALNEGLQHCRNELVARMDSDDLALPERCELQLKVFEAQPGLSICSGTLKEFTDDPNEIVGQRTVPEQMDEIVSFSKKRNPFNHPAVMFRKSAVETAGGYNETYHLFEDYYLWIRMLQNGCSGYNVQQPLLKMRVSMDAYERRGGLRYAMELLRFHSWIRKTHWTTWKDYLTGALPHAAVCVMPKRIRRFIYRFLR